MVVTAALLCGGCVGDDAGDWGESGGRLDAGDTFEDDDFPIGRSWEGDESQPRELAEDEDSDEYDEELDVVDGEGERPTDERGGEGVGHGFDREVDED